jgi:hypothetical protein
VTARPSDFRHRATRSTRLPPDRGFTTKGPRELAAAPGLTVQLIVRSGVVLIGMSVRVPGFDRVRERAPHRGRASRPPNNLLFERNDLGTSPDHASTLNPVHAVVWGDYKAKPAHMHVFSNGDVRHAGAAAAGPNGRRPGQDRRPPTTASTASPREVEPVTPLGLIGTPGSHGRFPRGPSLRALIGVRPLRRGQP